MKLDKNYKVRVTPEQSREIHSLILLEGGEVSYGLKPQLQDEFLVIENEHGSVVIYYTDQDIFLSAEQQEIQADDLIALLTDLSKSAENTLENTELTPEFDAVEPVLADNSVNTQDNSADIKDKPKFKVGDKVYVGLTGRIFQVTEIINDDVVSVANKNNEVRAGVSNICHATTENYEMLCKLYPHIEFERPPLTGNELCRKLLDKGEKYIMAKDDTDTWRIICDYCDDWFTDVVSGKCLKNVTPVSSKGEPLTQAVLDE
jgi:hypothetical protein